MEDLLKKNIKRVDLKEIQSKLDIINPNLVIIEKQINEVSKKSNSVDLENLNGNLN